MTKKSILRLLQASLMCCLAVLFTACDDIFASEDNPIPAYLSMSDKPVTIKVGDTYRRKAISVTTAVVEYTSSDTKVATVDGEGMVTAIAEGTATITATATGYSTGGKKIYQPDSKSYKLTVKPATLPAATITTDPTATAIIAAGSATALVTAGEAAGGTMMYEVTATNTKPTTTDGFSATVPTAATLAAAKYYVWYYAKADAQHSDSEIAATAIEVTVTEVYAANEYKEASWDGTKVVFTKKTADSEPTAVADASTDQEWNDGWYTVSGNVTITGKVTLGANTHLILQDGAKLTINGNGRILGSNQKLYIYGQANQTGQLVVNSSADAIRNIKTLEVHSCQVKATSSASTCGGFFSIGTFYVYGGSVDAEYTGSSGDGYGIYLQNHGSMNIYGGDVKAVGKGTDSSYSYGIASPSSTVTVYGGKLWAECVSFKALNNGNVTLAKGAGFTGKIETSDNGTSWTEYTSATTPSTRYVRVGY
jgi:hypothetical protein